MRRLTSSEKVILQQRRLCTKLNFIITCARNLEDHARKEIDQILDEFDFKGTDISKTGMSGILTVETATENKEFITQLIDKISDEPWSIRYCLRIIPIQSFVKTDLGSICDKVKELWKVSKDESYRITIEKRNSNISTKELITKIASDIKNKVSLENPAYIILVEVLGNKTGVSIIKPRGIFGLENIKREMS